MDKNLILDVDSYKMSHPFMYPQDTTGLFSYAESRGGVYEEIVFFGLQGFLLDNWQKPITMKDVKEADEFCQKHYVPFDRKGFERIVKVHKGHWPVRIKALREGTIVPTRTPLITVESTDPQLPWVVSFIETALLRAIWYPVTIASKAYAIRKGIDEIYSRHADSSANSDFAFLDFSSRGVEAYEANCVGGAAFLTSFFGSDSIPGIRWANHFYQSEMSAFSVKASEHSIMCSYGEDAEVESFRRLLSLANKGEILSVVSDTWDIYRACKYWADLAPEVYERGVNLSIRPDSGDYGDVLPQMLAILSSGFNVRKNDKGLNVFENLKILWGDGVSEKTYKDMLQTVINAGYGPEVLTLGSGGGLMQNVNRDTCKFAFKASAVKRGDKWHGIAKDPITDPGKKSKMGRLDVVRNSDGVFVLSDHGVRKPRLQRDEVSLLELVYENGVIHRTQTLDEIRGLIRGQ